MPRTPEDESLTTTSASRPSRPAFHSLSPSGFGRVWSLAFTGAFFLTGAYRLTLLGLAQSFARLPLAGAYRSRAGWAGFAEDFAAGFVGVALAGRRTGGSVSPS